MPVTVDHLSYSLIIIGNLQFIAVYDKFFNLLKEKGYTTYKIRKENLIGQSTLTKLKNRIGRLDTNTLNRLCDVLDCQPGDLISFVREE